MDEYEDMENDATATTPAPEEHAHEAINQARQTIRQMEEELERNRSGNAGILKATSGNAKKRLKMRQETRIITRAGKSTEVAMKHRSCKLRREKCKNGKRT